MSDEQPSAEAVKLMHAIRTHGSHRGAEFALNDKAAAQRIDALAARRAEQAVAQERERCRYWVGEFDGIQAIESGRPKP